MHTYALRFYDNGHQQIQKHLLRFENCKPSLNNSKEITNEVEPNDLKRERKSGEKYHKFLIYSSPSSLCFSLSRDLFLSLSLFGQLIMYSKHDLTHIEPT